MDLYLTDWASLSLNRDAKSLELIWRRECRSEAYREAVSESLRAIKEFNTPNWLSDISKLGTVPPADRLWEELYILPQAADGGLQNMAMVVPDNIFSQKYAHYIKAAAERLQLNVAHFNSLQTAREWLSGETRFIASQPMHRLNRDVN